MDSLKFFKLISEPLRIRILFMLKQSPLIVNELVEILEQSQSNISHHIKLLTDLNLIEINKNGNLNFYQIQENPNLSEFSKPVWSNIDSIAGEIAESTSDYTRLLEVLNKRKKKGINDDWQTWRKIQPDLPYTFELAYMGMPRNGLVVDVGCGDGGFLPYLTTSFNRIVAFDISINQLTGINANRKNKNTFLAQADAMALPLTNACANSIFFRMVLQFLPKPELALDEARRILDSGGRIAIIDILPSKFNAEYFSNYCREFETIRLLSYQKYSQVFIATLEKILI